MSDWFRKLVTKAIRIGGTEQLNRSALNLVAGDGVELTVQDRIVDDETRVTIRSTATGLTPTAAYTTLANPTDSSAVPVETPLKDVAGVINAIHYGLDEANDAADNDTALAAVLAAADGVPIYVPPGTYDVGATWLWENIRGQIVFGAGSTSSGLRRTNFRWTGEAGSSFIRLFGSRDCEIRDIEITFLDSGSVYVDDVILCETRSGSTSTNHTFQRVYITGPATARYNRGIAWTVGTGGNANNDLNTLESVICTNYADCAFDITHSQSTGHKFLGCAGGGGPICLRTNGAAFAWYEGTSHSGNSDADFKVVGAATVQQTYIKGFRSEGSGCFLDVSIGTSTMAISVEDCSVHSGNLREDGRIISWVGRSYLHVKNCRLGNNTANPGRVHLSSSGNRNSVQHLFENVRIITSLAEPFTADPPKTEINVSVENAGGTLHRGFRGGMGPHRSFYGSGQRTRTNTTPAWHVRDYPDATTTADDTPTTVLEIAVPTDSAGRASFAVVGRLSTGEIWSAIVDAHVVNDAGTVTVSDESISYKDPDGLGYSVGVSASGSSIVVQVTGGAADAVRWACTPELLTVAL